MRDLDVKLYRQTTHNYFWHLLLGHKLHGCFLIVFGLLSCKFCLHWHVRGLFAIGYSQNSLKQLSSAQKLLVIDGSSHAKQHYNLVLLIYHLEFKFSSKVSNDVIMDVVYT